MNHKLDTSLYCIFHSEEEVLKIAGKYLQVISSDTEITVHFTRCNFHYTFNLSDIDHKIRQQYKKENTDKIIYQFSDCIFSEPFFSNSQPEEKVIDISIKDSKFMNFVTITKFHLSGHLFISNSLFSSQVKISDSEFTEKFILSDNIFQKKIKFENNTFKKIVLHKVECKGFCGFQSNNFKILAITAGKYMDFWCGNAYVTNRMTFSSCHIGKLRLYGIYVEKGSLIVENSEPVHIDRLTACLIKHEAYKVNNLVVAIDFKVREMDEYRKEMWNKKNWGTYLLLTLNKWSNHYGKNWSKGVLFTIMCWWIFFSLFVMFREGIGNVFIWTDPAYMKEAIGYLWLLNGISEISACEEINWGMILFFILGKILIAYGIYQTVTAFRRYGKL